MLLVFSGKAFELLFDEMKRIVLSLKLKWSLLFVLLIIGPPVFFFLQIAIFEKMVTYYTDTSFLDFLRIAIFFFISMFYAKNKQEPIFYFFPLFVAVYFIGGDRVNMIGYIISLYYCLPYSRGINLGVLITSFYFLYANIDFVSRIISYGNGFPPN